MSWKVHETDEVFAALRGLCSNAYRMYDPCEHRYYYDHECDAYECVVEDAAEEYERLLRHCDHQREQLARHEMEDGMDNIDGGTEVERIEGSSITDGLREYVVSMCGYPHSAKCSGYNNLLDIADRIDADHAKAVERARMDGMDATFGDGWVKLPVDADGVPIHIGDLMEVDGDVFNVLSMELFCDGSWSIRNDVGNGFEYWELHHVQPDTFEQIIKEAADYGGRRTFSGTSGDKAYLAELVERCRRLAGEGA